MCFTILRKDREDIGYEIMEVSGNEAPFLLDSWLKKHAWMSQGLRHPSPLFLPHYWDNFWGASILHKDNVMADTSFHKLIRMKTCFVGLPIKALNNRREGFIGD